MGILSKKEWKKNHKSKIVTTSYSKKETVLAGIYSNANQSTIPV